MVCKTILYILVSDFWFTRGILNLYVWKLDNKDKLLNKFQLNSHRIDKALHVVKFEVC